VDTLLNWIVGFFQNLKAWSMDAFTWWIERMIVHGLEIMKWMMEVSYNAVTSWMDTLDLVTAFVGYWSNMPPTVIYVAQVLQIPQCISILLAAYALKVAMRFMPFF